MKSKERRKEMEREVKRRKEVNRERLPFCVHLAGIVGSNDWPVSEDQSQRQTHLSCDGTILVRPQVVITPSSRVSAPNLCRAGEWNKNTFLTFLTGPPTQHRSTNPSLFKEPKLQRRYTATFNVDTKDYISKTVSGTKVSIGDVFNYELPTNRYLTNGTKHFKIPAQETSHLFRWYKLLYLSRIHDSIFH